MSRPQITGKMVLAARDLLGLEQQDLAAASGVAVHTISRFENGTTVPRAATLDAIVQALENRGIEFSNGNSPGIKLRPEKAIIPLH